MSDYGRYGESGYANRGRERDQDRDRGWSRDRDRLQERGSRRSSMFGGRDDDDDDGPIRSARHGASRGGGERAWSHDLDRDDEHQDRHRGRAEREGSHFGHDDDHDGLPIDETTRLIASNKVEGTSVYGRGGHRLGVIYNFMVDKYSGQVEYAVMRYGGFLGMGQRFYPLPWRMLSYDTREGGYRIDMSERDLERAPSFSREDEPRFNKDYGRHVHDYYGMKY